LNALYQDLLNQDINNVKIIAIGKGQYSSENSNWTGDNIIPVVNDPLPNDLWTNWSARQWDFFFDTNVEMKTFFENKAISLLRK